MTGIINLSGKTLKLFNFVNKFRYNHCGKCGKNIKDIKVSGYVRGYYYRDCPCGNRNYYVCHPGDVRGVEELIGKKL